MEGPQPGRVGGAGRQRQVDRVALGAGAAGVLGEAGAGEEVAAALVHRDGEHPRVVPEGALDAVAVVHVDVDVGDPLGALLEQPGDRDRRVVVDAEAAAGSGHRVVQPAGDVDRVLGLAGPDRAGRRERGARDQRGGLVHAGEGRVVRGADAARQVGVPRVGAGRLDGLDVLLLVHQQQLVVGRRLGPDQRHVRQVEHAELAGQPHGEVDPQRVERVVRAEVVGDQRLVPRHTDRRAHAGHATRRTGRLTRCAGRRPGRADRPAGPGRRRRRCRPLPTPRRPAPGDHQAMTAGSGETAATSSADPTPRPMPIRPPTTQSSTASMRNCSRMSRCRAPSALRSPISRVRSRTLTSMMFETPDAADQQRDRGDRGEHQGQQAEDPPDRAEDLGLGDGRELLARRTCPAARPTSLLLQRLDVVGASAPSPRARRCGRRRTAAAPR